MATEADRIKIEFALAVYVRIHLGYSKTLGWGVSGTSLNTESRCASLTFKKGPPIPAWASYLSNAR